MRNCPKSVLLLLAAILTLLIAGCGGGGGGGGNSSGGTFTYVTDWSNRLPAGPTGQSQRIAIFDSNGSLVASQIMNQDEDGLQQIQFTNLAPGSYRVVVLLNSARDFSIGGVITGELEVIVTLNPSGTITTAVGDAIASVSVVPENATIRQQQSVDFTATALDTLGRPVFVVLDAFDWTVNGGVGTVNDDGLVLGTTVGVGSVVAEHTPSGLTDAGVLNVTAFNPTQSKWTILVFLNAANDLNQFGDLNFNQMEQVAGNAQVRFVVQWKQAVLPGISPNPSFVGTRRYLVKEDNSNQINSELIQDMGNDVDMGSGTTLREFIEWGTTYFPADRYVLVIWNHGNGWKRGLRVEPTRGVSYDDETGNSIDTWELPESLGDTKMDILAWDASLMQMLEIAYEVRDKATYIVGSEESPPGAGYPYHTVFADFESNPDKTTEQLARNFVDATLAVPAYATQKITQSVLDASELADLATSLNGLALALLTEFNATPTDFATYIQAARLNAQAYSPTSTRTYRDVVGLTLELDKTVGNYSPSAPILAANQAVRAAASQAIVYEGHNANSPGSHGVSIDFSQGIRFSGYKADYLMLDFAQSTNWDEWLTVAP